MAGTSKFSHHVDHDLQRLVTTWAGEVLSEDIAAHFEQREAIGATGYDQLSDFRNARISATTLQAERLAAAILRKTQVSRFGRVAILASDDVSFGMARMFGTLVAPDYTVNVFRSYAEAREWLGWTQSRSKRPIAQKVGALRHP